MLYSKLSSMQLQKVVCYKVLVGLHDMSWYIIHDIYNKVVSCSLDFRGAYSVGNLPVILFYSTNIATCIYFDWEQWHNCPSYT